MKILRIIMNDDLPDAVKKCLDILDENLEILSNIEIDLNDEKNDELVPETVSYTHLTLPTIYSV